MDHQAHPAFTRVLRIGTLALRLYNKHFIYRAILAALLFRILSAYTLVVNSNSFIRMLFYNLPPALSFPLPFHPSPTPVVSSFSSTPQFSYNSSKSGLGLTFPKTLHLPPPLPICRQFFLFSLFFLRNVHSELGQ